jgi:glycerol-3-phosphate O-acyltransferase
MELYLKSKILSLLEEEKNNFQKDVFDHLATFFYAYDKVQKDKKLEEEPLTRNLKRYLSLIKDEIENPTQFGTFHKREETPVDLYDFAIDVLRPFIDKEESNIHGKENIQTIISLLKKGENVLLLANHQAEADPGILGVLLDDLFPGLIKDMIAVAGARVTTDPLAVPFTRGQNVICVYSKKYFELHSDKKKEMQQHNSSSMLALRHLLNKGGKLIYVAPSGGRDRKDAAGNLSPAPFDPESIELMRVVGHKAKSKTHYFPLALYTYPILPPPETIKKAIGEKRNMCHSPVHLYFGEEIIMIPPTAEEKKEKITFRQKQARDIHSTVKKLYKIITSQ